MILRLGHPRCAIVVAPHPDDETIGAFGLLRALRGRGTDVRVLIVSDGGASHPGSANWPKSRLIRARRAETVRAMRAAGISRGMIYFLSLPDGDLPRHALPCARLIGRELRRARRLDLVVGPTPDDDHADHRTVASAISGSRLPGVRRLGYRVWPVRPVGERSRVLPLGSFGRSAKRRAIRLYRTQTGAIADSPTGFVMSRAELAAFSRSGEAFRELRA